MRLRVLFARAARRQAAEHLAEKWVALEVGRNDPYPCGSGKKHKKCCGL